MQTWLKTAVPGDADLLLQVAPQDVRERMAALLLDLLSDYPCVIVGCPVQIYAQVTPACDAAPVLPSYPTCIVPVRGLVFLSWLSPYAGLPYAWPAVHAVPVTTGRLQCSVAVFRVAQGYAADLPTIPDAFWSRLFENYCTRPRLAAHGLYLLPAALDVARVLQAADRGTRIESSEYPYLTPALLERSCTTAPHFRAETAPHFAHFDEAVPDSAHDDI